MAELLPLAQANRITHSLLDYLGTTFALADPDARRVLAEFLSHPQTGMFRGPYVRARLPFRPAADGWRKHLEWYEGFPPYGHQAAAFARLSSYRLSAERPRPQPTLVTTGTGSGKTEAFLYPILDHVQRAKRQGVTGMKALILYPMNALANDQALRLTSLLTENAALAGVTAALYTGEGGAQRTKVTADGLITDRAVIRDLAPDILLTNYKMLDQLLLRPADADIWRQSTHSLQYLVLDEFHTYDGAQGTDVSMLLRRLGLTLKSHWQPSDSTLTDADWQRPLGRITPVATSATLGDGGDPTAMLQFAETVFGETFDPDAVITESRLTFEEWAADARQHIQADGWQPAVLDEARVADIANSAAEQPDPSARALAVLRGLYDGGDDTTLATAITNDDQLVLDLVKVHPVFAELAANPGAAATIDILSRHLFDYAARDDVDDAAHRHAVTNALVDTLSHVRARHGRGALSIDVHLWVRELTRLARAATGSPHFLWEDDGVQLGADDTGATTFLPALYCRHCNRSGWGVTLAPTGWDLDADDTTIRRRRLRNDDRFRALIHAPVEADKYDPADEEQKSAPSRLAWLMMPERRLEFTTPPEDKLAEGNALPVLVHCSDTAGQDSVNDTCPSCRQPDGIRFLGSAIATMLSVSLSTLFGTPELDSAEKRALVFTDSVQDAAHRAGFVQARSHALTLRTLARQALDGGETDIASLAHRMIDLAGNDPGARYRLLPPELAEREAFTAFWRPRAVSAKTRNLVRRRLLLDLQLEFGLRSSVGRTLETTGSAVAHIEVAESVLRSCATEALEAAGAQLTFGRADDARQLAWVRGVLERMRSRGAIEHEWFDKFRREDGNRWWVTGGRRRDQGMPGFGKGNSAPGFPVLGGSVRDTDLEPVSAARGWYPMWTAKVLGLAASEAAVLARLLFTRLRHRDVIGEVVTSSGGQTFHLPATAVVARIVDETELASGSISLICDTCRNTVHSYPATVEQLDGAPCLVARCVGVMRRNQVEDNFYRQMYAATDVRRVVSREHTSLLPAETRLLYESQFKQTDPPPDAPNVLVATPTLEMGIDIGDLSAVLLSSLPRTVASYLQRVGRAGRLTGNALALAYVTGRGDQLPRFSHPERTINGAVRPPATYLDAEEILRRQFTASVADVLARRPNAPHPRNTPEALQSSGSGSYLGALIAEAESVADELVDSFLAGFPPLDDDVVARLRHFPKPNQSGSGTSEFAHRCLVASQAWTRRVETLSHRKTAAEKALPSLLERATSPAATDDDKRELRTAQASVRLIAKQLANLRSEYWISAMESLGLLPNYTLLDDSVTLSVSVNWQNPETQEYEHSEFELTRGSAQALRDFAPGSTFYSRGFAIAIDAIDLGPEGEHVRDWACCPRCGFARELDRQGAPAPSQCPRCGSHGIADVSQRLPVAELTSVSAIIRREEATIDDVNDERTRERFTVQPLADIDHANITKHWFVQPSGFGAKHLRNLTIRWVNLGRSGVGGAKRLVAGNEIDATLFRVCSECGKLDTTSGANRRSEHRPWCSRRDAYEESATEVALARTLVTEGLVLRLPQSITLGDGFAIPSLSAAVLLGLREQIGGDPDHLQIATVVDPSPRGHTEQALLLHDIVPGGTGYLSDFTDPATVWDLLHRAWRVVRDCGCREDGRLACERCLLPFVAPPDVRYTSRSVAERHLASLLLGREIKAGEDAVVPASISWTITDTEPGINDPESNLEKRFRVVLAKRLKALGAAITEKPTASGVAWDIALGSTHRWTLRPQEYVLGCQPDFILTYAGGGIAPTAIFTDGWLYHASPAHNRLADDADKRRNLRDAGYQVIAVTNDDVNETPLSSPALRPEVEAALLSTAGDQLSKAMVGLVFGTALDLLVAWIQQPFRDARERLANWLPAMALMGTNQSGKRTGDAEALAQLALEAVDAATVEEPSGNTFVWSFGGFAFAVRMTGQPFSAETAIFIDDNDDALHTDSRDSWQEWLKWSNLLNFRTVPAVITTRRQLMYATPEQPITPVPKETMEPTGLTGAWLAAYEEADTGGQELIIKLADADVPAPDVGEEVDGIPVELTWPTWRIAVDIGLDDSERQDLAAAGWTVCPPDIDTLKAALQNGGS
ncbi:DEAD/DEAH box helicase [Mycobacterium sp. 852014-52144_SCH5372336]|uniref:DEAD/DEAH box helicase n=1 Tax=Mycobacterium sp. 852014-52144_SCH5372336 TaxID=1834115 RepID=UPI0007FCC03D|nr:DEAD/DEAH box helicase [Mycobacterium sp. 852014-52144_SCH5372336]OBB77110.1 heavy metal resistance protein CzcA [Mycobacterium sp. 852014-52144_SCH5372336]